MAAIESLGIYIRGHADLLCEAFPIQIYSPSGMNIHKENLAPLCGYSFSFIVHRNPEQVALELSNGKDMCYSKHQYETMLETLPTHFQRDAEGELMYTGNRYHIDNEEIFENACEKIVGKQKWVKKIYEISTNPLEFSIFTIAFQGKTCNMLTTSISDFCSLFDFTLILQETQQLSSLFDEMKETQKFTTEFIFEIASLFQRYKGVTNVHILDESCSSPNNPYSTTCRIEKDTLQDFVEEHDLGFGGSKKKKTKKKRKKNTKKNKNKKKLYVGIKFTKSTIRRVRTD